MCLSILFRMKIFSSQYIKIRIYNLFPHSGGASGVGVGISPFPLLFDDSSLSFQKKVRLKFLRFREKMSLKFSPVLGRKTLLTVLSFRRQFLMSFSQFLEIVYDGLSPIVETVSDQFSSILKIVSDKFSSFFEDSFCNISSPTFRKVSTSSNTFNESHKDAIGQQLSRAWPPSAAKKLSNRFCLNAKHFCQKKLPHHEDVVKSLH